MRRRATAIAILLAAAIQLPVFAQSNAQTPSNAAEIEACMREAREGTKAGQKTMTPQQRMVAEEQCRARVEAASQSKKK